MTKILLTGGSGFIATHILNLLLQRGHDVITTVRSNDKAKKIRETYNELAPSRLDFRIVEDIAQPGAFDETLKIEGLKVVIHTASPFSFSVKDVKKDLLDPAINGTKGLLEAVKKNAPLVERVVITSSFASIINVNKSSEDSSVNYSEESWNPITETQAFDNTVFGYRASKTFAERAAWEFLEREKPNFTITTVNPPIVYGPIAYHINASNKRIYDFISGNYNETLSAHISLWVDVRDVALAHIKAFELDEAAGKRLFVVAGKTSDKQVLQIIKENFPDLQTKLPKWDTSLRQNDSYNYDNSKTVGIIGPTKYTLDCSIVDTVKSLQNFNP